MTRVAHLTIGIAAAIDTLAIVPATTGLLVGAGVLAGANLPDDLEIPLRGDPPRTVIPHRTVTHWPYPYAVAAVVLASIGHPLAFLGAGLTLGALLHLLCDSLSPHGIPWASPFRSRKPRTALYKTRAGSEWRIVGPAILTATAAIALRHADLLDLASSLFSSGTRALGSLGARL